MLKVGEGLDV